MRMCTLTQHLKSDSQWELVQDQCTCDFIVLFLFTPYIFTFIYNHKDYKKNFIDKQKKNYHQNLGIRDV